MKKLFVLGIAALAACGGEDKKPTFTKPAGTVAVNFSVDDTANKVFAAGDLKWKGSMIYDTATNKVTKDDTWGGAWDTSKVTIKGSGWAWSEVTLLDDGTKGDAAAGDGKFTYQLSQYVGAGKKFPHTGLANSGDKPEFIVVFNGKEYKDASG